LKNHLFYPVLNIMCGDETIVSSSNKILYGTSRIIGYTIRLIHSNTSTCNVRDIEVLAAITPYYGDMLVAMRPVTGGAGERLDKLVDSSEPGLQTLRRAGV
jgi:hypothetical protein